MSRIAMILAACLLVAAAVYAVQHDDGPAEALGEKIDGAVTDAGNSVEDACEELTSENC